MPRILMVTPVLKSQRGNSITAARLYNGLGRKGYEIDLLSLDEPGWKEKLDLCTRVNSYDLVHGLHALHFSTAAKHPAVKNLPVLLTITGTDVNYDLAGPDKNKVLETLLMTERIVVFNQEMGRKVAAADAGLTSRISVIPQGVDLPAAQGITRSQLGLSESDTVFILPSGLRPVKNLDLALDGLGLARSRNPQMSLLIAGAVIDNAYGEHIRSRLGELPWVTYTGEVPHGEISGIMLISDVVLNTSQSEGQPQSVLEAMSLGKPCILTAVPGNLGIITDGVQGFYINSAGELADAALRLIDDPDLRNEMGRSARQLACDNYSVEKEINAYAALYDAMLA